jgi:hypothetical protein
LPVAVGTHDNHLQSGRRKKMATEQQVFAGAGVKLDHIENLSWSWEGDDVIAVPQGKVLVVGTLTLNYFPTPDNTLARAEITGRDSNDAAVWRLQTIYVEPKKTVHLTFPQGLRVEAGGYVEIGSMYEGAGPIFLNANGILLSQRAE